MMMLCVSTSIYAQKQFPSTNSSRSSTSSKKIKPKAKASKKKNTNSKRKEQRKIKGDLMNLRLKTHGCRNG